MSAKFEVDDKIEVVESAIKGDNQMKTIRRIKVPKPVTQTQLLRPLSQFTITRRSRPDNEFCESLLVKAPSKDCALIEYAMKRGSTRERMDQLYFVSVEEFKE